MLLPQFLIRLGQVFDNDSKNVYSQSYSTFCTSLAPLAGIKNTQLGKKFRSNLGLFAME